MVGRGGSQLVEDIRELRVLRRDQRADRAQTTQTPKRTQPMTNVGERTRSGSRSRRATRAWSGRAGMAIGGGWVFDDRHSAVA